MKAEARTFRQFLRELDPIRPLQVLCHVDADGLAAGAILQETLHRLGFVLNPILLPAKGENAFSPGTRAELRGKDLGALLVLDLGCSDQTIVEGIPTLFLDHHQPFRVPEGAVLINSFAAPSPQPSTAPSPFGFARPWRR